MIVPTFNSYAVPNIASSASFYFTDFPLTENPLSEGGVWTNGLSVGLDWTDVQSGNGVAFRTQSVHAPPPYDDSIACLSSFPPNHYAQGIVSRAGDSGELEIELLLRWKITAHSARGYEIDIINNGNVYIVRWNGALNDFTILSGPTASSSNNGDVWYGEVVGTVITVKRNGTTVATYDTAGDVTKWSDGNPGIGFYTDNSLGAPSAGSTYSWTSFTSAAL